MDLEKIILRKLFRRRIIGGKHTAIENLTKGLPKHTVGEAKSAVDNLIKKNLILTKQTSYGLQVSLNPDKIEHIYELIGI
jgi:predicted transcriptional regulator